MKKLIPHPGLSILLFSIWLAANNSLSPGHFLLGGILAILIPIITIASIPKQIRFIRPVLIIIYLGRFILDIITANIRVALLIIQPNRKLKPAFIRYELALDSPLAISVLANTISLAPGTVSCDIASDQQHLLIHSLHVGDPISVISSIHDRYEQLLLEMLKP